MTVACEMQLSVDKFRITFLSKILTIDTEIPSSFIRQTDTRVMKTVLLGNNPAHISALYMKFIHGLLCPPSPLKWVPHVMKHCVYRVNYTNAGHCTNHWHS